MLRKLGFACLLLAPAFSPAQSQLSVVPPVNDLSGYAKATDLTSAINAATPPDCTAPAADTLNGAAGSASRCMPRADASRPTAVQAINTALAADCTWSVVFGRATVSAYPVVHASVVLPLGSTQPIPCSLIARSTTGASGKCFPAQTTSLAAVSVAGVSVAVGSQVVNPTSSTCTAGMPVMINVREPTQ